MGEDDPRFCFRFIIIMQMANAHHKRHIPGAGPHNPYLPPQIRLNGNLDGVWCLWAMCSGSCARFAFCEKNCLRNTLMRGRIFFKIAIVGDRPRLG